MGNKTDKFLLLMWKNWILQIRHPIQTFLEIVIPIIFCSILVYVRSIVNNEVESEIVYPTFSPILKKSRITEIAYSPNGPAVIGILKNMRLSTPLIGFGNHHTLETYLVNENSYDKVGLVFDDSLLTAKVLPKKIYFTLRFPSELHSLEPSPWYNWHTNLIFSPLERMGPRERQQKQTATPNYYQEGFLDLQFRTFKAIMDNFNNNKSTEAISDIKLSRFPYPSFFNDPLLPPLQRVTGLVILLAFVYTTISTIKIITAEKEKQLKEYMKIMGLPVWLHWTAWFIKSLLFMLISIIIICILFKSNFYYKKVGPVFKNSDGVILFLFLFLYVCANITFCFLMSVFFSKANYAAGFGGIMFFIFYVPYSIIQDSYLYLSAATKLLSSLLHNSAMGYGFRIICMFEITQEGLQWGNIWETVVPDDNIVMFEIMLMLLLDCILYLLLTLYIEAIFPGKFGVPKKWNFICVPQRKIRVSNAVEGYSKQDPSSFEDEPQSEKGIEINHLRKVYPKHYVAVNDFSLNVFENQITVLLGHNGAGKTTLMSMLTGMFPPTSGNATINGYDICTHIDQVRSSLGLCPQHNILFDELTVKEHIYFYGRLKGMNKRDIRDEIDSYVSLLQLEDKRNKKSVTLSGGMKRKLSVAVAFCGNSKVVILDEPTAGMDPAARRSLWEIVQKQKQNRTIMLTTHFMDEADILGDRIAIMANGDLKCCGTSFFLKKKFGTGYHLIIDKKLDCDVNEITKLLNSHLPGIKVHSNIGSELTYLLRKSDSAVFEKMLKDIESKSTSLGILSYGISLTTLEEVFMKVGVDEQVEAQPDTNLRSLYYDIQELQSNLILTGYKLRINQFNAMLVKRFLTTVRSWLVLLLLLILPMIFVLFAILASRKSALRDLPRMKISLNVYNSPVVPISTNQIKNSMYLNAKKYIMSQSKATLKDLGTEDMIGIMLKLTKDQPSTVKMRYIIGGHFDENRAIAWFNNDPYHSPPLALNFILNTVLKTTLGHEYEVGVYNHPLPFLLKSKLGEGESELAFQLAFNIGFAMAFISALFVLFYIRERVCKSKHLQFVSGANIFIFWTASFFCDFLMYAVSVCLLILLLICFQEDGFKTWNDIEILIVIFICFGCSMLPLMYLMSFLFNMPSTGFVRIILFAVIFGSFTFMVVEILWDPSLHKTSLGNTLDWIFIFIPHYSLSSAIKLANVEYHRFTNCQLMVKNCLDLPLSIPEKVCWSEVCAKQKDCCEPAVSYYRWQKPGILRNIVIFIIVAVLLVIILFLVEFKILARIKYMITLKVLSKRYLSSDEIDMDSDVIEENNKIRQLTSDQIKQYALVLNNITKYYGTFLAVNQICLGVRHYECFGLLGVNGAGKTSTFRMMTGDTNITFGDIFIRGLNLKTNYKDINKQIGYCPQFDALLEDLTAKETLIFFAKLRGYCQADSWYWAYKLSIGLDFHKHLNKLVKNLSGGNKRKLSVAVALLGDPPLLFFDEPTTGMDPATKRYLWNVLCSERDNGKCLILTSHSMEECEALCTRVAIMVNGRFQCIGSKQHLKNKFSKGYILTIKLKKDAVGKIKYSDIERYVKDRFETAVVREKFHDLISFYLETDFPWSTIFGYIEKAKDKLDIEDYLVGQPSLEDVFLSFTTVQNDNVVQYS